MNKDTKQWTALAHAKLVGKKIVAVEYMPKDEVEASMWDYSPICLKLDDGTWVFPMRDDEGNDGGVLYYTGTSSKDSAVLPVMRPNMKGGM